MTKKQLKLLHTLIESLIDSKQYDLAYEVLNPFYFRYLADHPELSGLMGMIDMQKFLNTEEE